MPVFSFSAKKYFRFFVYFILFCPPFLQATIHTVYNFDKLKEEIEKLDEKALVIFDVDDVILHPKDHILRSVSDTYRAALSKKYLSGLQANEHQLLISRIWLRNDWCTLIDSELPHLIATLQKRKIKVIALTAVSTGDFGVIQSLPDWRIRDLKNLKIDFSLAFPDTHHLILNQEAFAWNVPAFKSGVLFSSPYPKGLVLKEFLNAMNYKPKQVIFIDDYLANVESVAQALESMSIPYLGLHYLGAEIVPIEYDEAVAELQYRYLREKETWLSDQEAKELLVD